MPDATRSEIVVNSSHKDTRAWLTSGLGQCRASENCIYHRARA